MNKKLFATEKPELLSEWDYEKNTHICSPFDIGPGSSKKVWWKCSKCGLSFEARIADRSKGGGCPYCAGKKAIAGKTDLATTNPDLLKEWNYEKNSVLGIYPTNVTKGSNKKVWWKCSKDHEWQASINNRSNGASCPYCSGRKAIKGESDLASKRPDLLNEWDYEKNASICNPEEITVGSHTKVWWKCSEGHSWQATIKSRANGIGCPYCSNKKVEPGYNDLASQYPELLSEWDYSKNDALGIYPTQITKGSPRKVWWKCSDCGHEWQAAIVNRTGGSGCPVCAYRKSAQTNSIAKYENSLSYLHPELLEEWDYEKNDDLSPDTVNVGSPRKVWWKCKKCNQSYLSPVSNRASGVGCPVCAGKVIVPGINDLKTWCLANKREDILSEWDYKKNTLTPENIAPFSGKRVFFICKEGHSYSASLSNRTTNSTGCPICEKNHKSSFPEQAIFYYLNRIFSDVYNSYHADWLGKQELDIFIPSIQTAIEYDGINWHKNKIEKEQKKDLLCKMRGIRLIRVREIGLDNLESSECLFVDPRKKGALDTVIVSVVKAVGGDAVVIDVDTDRDTADIVAQFDKNKKENSISNKYPELIEEWDYDRNGSINPEFVNYGSTRKYWWKCKDCGTEFLMAPNHRTHQGQGCPLCSSKKAGESIIRRAVAKKGSFQDSNSPLLEEWNYEKNTISPAEITRASKKKVWWKCKKCGGSWLASVQNRVLADNKCPYCSGRKVLTGFNDFATLHPELLSEWDYDKNNALGIYPSQVTKGSSKKVWWRCSKGHEWQATIDDRSLGHGCPYCSGLKVITGKTDLASTHPNLLVEWDYDKNTANDLNPQSLSSGSNKKVWWKCAECGHEWQATIGNRARGQGCPVCSRKTQSNQQKKRVECIETGIVFDSIIAATKWAGISAGSLVNHLKGKTKSSGGYHWKYSDK